MQAGRMAAAIQAATQATLPDEMPQAWRPKNLTTPILASPQAVAMLSVATMDQTVVVAKGAWPSSTASAKPAASNQAKKDRCHNSKASASHAARERFDARSTLSSKIWRSVQSERMR